MMTKMSLTNKDWYIMADKLKTRDFEDIEKLTNYMVRHLYSLYDELAIADGADYMFSFLEGSIETTQHYLMKSGVDFLEESEYNKAVASMTERD